jgi:DNA sulfur modification protein DndD
MIFKSLTITNLFSYHGEVTFDLTAPAGRDGNIVVIMGRNGHGKTSFLNSAKLLFGGVTKELMAGVQRGSPATQKSFVLGHQDWWGILNHKARQNGETRCSVAAVLVDEVNQETKVRRSWDLRNGDYKDRLQVWAPRKSALEDEVAQQYLSRLLPLDYIPFFFFDAEEVGYSP